jgi:hypothetical protein
MFGSLTHGFFNFQVFGCKEYIILLGRDKVMLNHACNHPLYLLNVIVKCSSL